MKFRIALISILLSFLYGCATGPAFTVSVDSISAPESLTKLKYTLLPSNENVDESDLQYREYVSYVERALESRGYIESENPQEADIAIFLGYGIGDPKTHQFTYSIPTYGQTGVSSSHTTGNAYAYGNNATYSGTTTYTPTYGVTGSTSQSGEYTTYFRYIFLNAYDLVEFRKTNKEKQVWKTKITSTGSSDDLRLVIPVMLGASKSHIGTNTGKIINVDIRENDRRVKEIKGLQIK